MKNINFSEDNEIRLNRLRDFELSAVMGAGSGFFPIYSFLVVAATLVIHPGVSRLTSAVWAATYLVYTAVRTIATSLYKNDENKSDSKKVNRWRKFVFCSAVTHGAILGSLALFALPSLNPARQLMLTCFVLLVTTGAVIYVSAILPALLALITFALIPFVFAWRGQINTFDLPVSWFLLIAWALNIFMSWIYHRAGSRFFLLAADNEALVREMECKNRELEAADQARVQLLAITSHDLRQPVHALRLILAHVSEHDDAKVLKQQLEKLREISNLIAQMLLELMDLSAFEQQNKAKRLEAVCLTEILRQLRTSQEPLAKKKGITLDIQEDQEIWVQADTSLLRRMLLNLLSNAIKYTSVGGVRVECKVRGAHVLISVCDSGIGIPSSRLNDIFRPYVRLDPLVVDKDGVGLGLAIVHRAAVVQGLEINVASTVGVGSIFEISALVAERQPQCHVVKQELTKDKSLLDVYIAVVDDDFFAREALVALLRRWGYFPIAGETLAALHKALDESKKPSLIITDNHLSPIEFGPDVIVDVRRRFDDQSIAGIIMTGDPDVVLDGLSRAKLVHKPLDPAFLELLVLRMTSSDWTPEHEEVSLKY